MNEQSLEMTLRDKIANEVISYDREGNDPHEHGCSTWLEFARRYADRHSAEIADTPDEPADHCDCWHTAVRRAYEAADRIMAILG